MSEDSKITNNIINNIIEGLIKKDKYNWNEM